MAGPFDAPNVNWQLLADLPDQWAAGKQWREERDTNASASQAISRAYRNGVFDPRAAIEELGKLGNVNAMTKLAPVLKAMQPERMTPYQAAQLAWERERQGLPTEAMRNADFFGNLPPEDPRRQYGPRAGPRGVIEGLRQKLASGQPLTPAEQKVYDDAQRGDPIMRALIDRISSEEDGNPFLPGASDGVSEGELQPSPQPAVTPRPPLAARPSVPAMVPLHISRPMAP